MVRIGRMEVFIFMALLTMLYCITLFGCTSKEDQAFQQATEQASRVCHDNIYRRAKWSAEIVSTNVSNLTGDFSVTGRAKLQNGFGAWTQYSYACVVSNDGYFTLSGIVLNEGW